MVCSPALESVLIFGQVLRDLEAQRLEAVGCKLRIQREELEQRKKDSQIKLTDKVPSIKRYRGGCKSLTYVFVSGGLTIDLMQFRGAITATENTFAKDSCRCCQNAERHLRRAYDAYNAGLEDVSDSI